MQAPRRHVLRGKRWDSALNRLLDEIIHDLRNVLASENVILHGKTILRQRRTQNT
jgi:hypothetical protein